ncbi:MAG: MarR family winged helix-turn-helix transcriptional regulator [Cellulomonadaceae bacterium]
MTDAPQHEQYWYDDDVVDLLEAVRRFRRSDQEMRRRMAAQMGMNVADMRALQLVIAAERSAATVTPTDISVELGVSTAATTKLLDRLTASGHLVREPHPTDRRALTLRATAHAHEERDRLGPMHAAMADAARAVPVGERATVIGFLEAMADCLDDSVDVAPLTPGPGSPAAASA